MRKKGEGRRAKYLRGARAQESIDSAKRIGQIGAAQADAEVVAGVIEQGAGKEENTFVPSERFGEVIDRLAGRERRKGRAAAAWALPGELPRMGSEELIEPREVRGDYPISSLEQCLTSAERHDR